MATQKDNPKELRSLLVKANSVFNHYANFNQTASFSVSDLYRALDFPETITYDDYLQRYKRQDIANRVVKAPVAGTWKDIPKIYETVDEETAFEKAWDDLSVTLDLYNHFYKLDLLASIGRFALLYLGLDDATDPSVPAGKSKRISFVTPIPENRIDIYSWENDISSPRYGYPSSYQVSIDNETSSSGMTRLIDWTRVIHVAEDTIENDVYGCPAMEKIYNRLVGLDKLAGGSPEMYWRGARPGYTAHSTENAIITDEGLKQLKSELSDFVNNLNRFIFAEGIKVTPMSPQVVSPKEHVDTQLQLISAATRIPTRILIGSERGELASTQDERAWLNYLEERRESVAAGKIIRPFIDRMISFGILPEPKSGEYFISWDPLVVLSEKEKAEIAKLRTDSLATYVNSPGADAIIPVESFLDMLGFSEEEIELMLNIAEEQLNQEDSLREEPPKEEQPQEDRNNGEERTEEV